MNNELARELRLQSMVDEIGDLEAELAPVAPKIRRLDNLRDALRKEYDNDDAESSFTAEGTRYVIEVGARSWQSVVDRLLLYQSVNFGDFLLMVSPVLKKMEEICKPDLIKKVVTRKQTGYRSLIITAKGQRAA